MQLNYVDAPGPVPATYTLPASQAFELESVSAYFNGAGAGGDFLACLSVYSQDGKLIFRAPADQVLAAGDSAEVSFYPLADQAASAAATGSSLPVAYLWDDAVGSTALAAGAGFTKTWDHFTPFGSITTTGNQSLDLPAGEAIYQFDVFMYCRKTAGARTLGDVSLDIQFMTAAFAVPAIFGNSPVQGTATDMVAWCRMYDGITSATSYSVAVLNLSGVNAYNLLTGYFIVTRLYATTP